MSIKLRGHGQVCIMAMDLLNQIEYHPLTLLHELIKTI